MAYKTMTTTTVADKSERTVSITVEHDPAQSYSRAVKPRAFKEFKNWTRENIMFGAPEFIGVDYNDKQSAKLDRVHTTYSFKY